MVPHPDCLEATSANTHAVQRDELLTCRQIEGAAMSLRRDFKFFTTHFVCASAILFVSFATALSQQSAARPDRGAAATGSFAISDVENINLSNGNLNLSI